MIDFVVERSPLFISSSPFFWRFHSNHLISFLLIFTHNSYKKNLLSMSKKISSQQEKREEREKERVGKGAPLSFPEEAMLTSRECAAFLLLAHLSTAIFCSATRDGDFFASEKSFVGEEALPFDENDHAQTRALLWSQKAPDLNVLDTTKSTENTQTTSIADQLVKELDTVVDETSASQRAAGDIASATDDGNDNNNSKTSSNAIENAILDSEAFREKIKQNGRNDPGWTEEDRQLEQSLETKWINNPDEDISREWHNAYEEKYSAGIVDEKKEEVLEIEEEMEKNEELTFGELIATSATSGKKSSKSKKTRKEKALKTSDDVLNVVLVGNGKSVLKKNNGKTIDSADVVGRFNYFQTKGYEKKIGTRLDLWFLGELRQPGPRGSRGSRLSTGRMDMKMKPTLRYIVPVVYETPRKCSKMNCKPSNAKLKQRVATIGMVKKAYAKYGIRKMLEIMPIEVQHRLSTKYGYTTPWPSSGILAIIYCLEKYRNATVTITGYDFMGGNLGHYWEKVKKKGTVHSMKGEASFIAQLVKNGRVKVM